MHVYIAAVYTSGISLHSNEFRRLQGIEQQIRAGLPNILESYHYVHKDRFVNMMRRDRVQVFLDSGAFSAMSLGAEINIDQFCEYIHRNADLIRCVSVLDGIGDPLKTWRNQKYMESMGVKPLPCFHYGEDERYLEHYIAEYPYITLGGMVPIAKPQLKMWLDRVWSRYLTDKDGLPKIKVHGFGLTRVDLMVRYPWFSVDSSSWVAASVNGAIFFPQWGQVYLSKQSGLRQVDGRHYDTYSPHEQKKIRDHLESYGFDFERCQNLRSTRLAANMLGYMTITDPSAPPRPFKLDAGLFDEI